MNALSRFWRDQFGIDHPLEADSRVHRLLNRYVVAALMNTFPKTITKIFSLSNGDLARLLFVERDGGSFRSLRAMYDYQNPRKRGDLINRLIMQSPAIKAARNRRILAQRLLERCLEAQPENVPVLVLAIGGGDGNLEAEVIARMTGRKIYYCAVDKDERAVSENKKVLAAHGLQEKGFVWVGTVAGEADLEAVVQTARQRFETPFDGIGVTVCHGIAEYFDMGSQSNEALAALLSGVLACTRPEGNLVISQTDYHDRVKYLERGLAWYMRLRSSGELATVVETSGWQLSLCEQEPMRLITMCLAMKSDVPHRFIDSPSQLRRPHVPSAVPAAALQHR